MIITIDGPSGTGKTTVAKKVAEKLGILYFDSGAMYRAVTWGLLKQGIDFQDQQRVQEFLNSFKFEIRKQNGEKHYFVNEFDVTKEIRTQIINEHVSQVSAIPIVRQAMWKIQREYVEKQSAVFEGRDMGSVVFPKAEVKIFLDASPEVRAKRRLDEMRISHPQDAATFDVKSMEKELIRRDSLDEGRKIAPLKCPKGALRIDTSHLEIDQVVEQILKAYHAKAEKLIPSWFHARKMKLFYRFIIFLSWVYFRTFHHLKIYGLEHYIKRAAIIAPNHTSYFDPPIVSTSWPNEVHFLARESLFKPFLFGKFIRALNSHPLHGDVGDMSVFRTIFKILEEGKQIVIFPEGKRTHGTFEEIKPGIGMLLMRSKTAIIPTYIHGAYDVWGRERKLPKLFGKIVCVFGTPISWESFAHLEKREAQTQIADRLAAALVALKSWVEAGAEGIPP